VSLSRLALRLAAYEALCPFAVIATGPWPTLAGSNVFDSRMDPIASSDDWSAFIESIEGKPILTVYTEEQEADPVAGEYEADREMVDLVIELMIAAAGSVEVAGADGSTQIIGAISAPITDRQHEAMLDILEAQVRRVLDPQGYAGPQVYRDVARELHHVHSSPQRDPDKVTRVAARTLKLKIRVPATSWPLAPTVPPATGLALLPQPLLGVALALDPGSTGGQTCAAAANWIAQPAPLVPLTDIRAYANLDRGATPTASNADETADVPLSG
jgi:hypothetical protein